MNTIQLPKLRKVTARRDKKKILLICDDIRFFSGVATIAREIVIGTVHEFDWVQLAAALQHPDHSKRIDLSQDIAKETGVDDAYVMQYCHTGYGNPNVIREIIGIEKPDALFLITDPRFFGHVWEMEHELRNKLKIPVVYLNIWDNLPYPYWNSAAYASCDLLLAINRQTEVINKKVLDWHNKFSTNNKPCRFAYVPHGSSTKYFYPQTPTSPDWELYSKFATDFKQKYQADFFILFNSRNIRRKSPGDIILSYAKFCDGLTPEQVKKVCLIMKTALIDENGTDLMAVKRAICPKYKIAFIPDAAGVQQMNWLYNISDCVFFMSSAEGFGLAANEAMLCGKMVVAPVTGGLQDQMRFEDETGNWISVDESFTTNQLGQYEKCGSWAVPMVPGARVLNGSVATPYIFDDYTDAEQGAEALRKVYDIDLETRYAFGEQGRLWALSEESGMSSPEMCKRVVSEVTGLIETWKPNETSWELLKIDSRPAFEQTGIVWKTA